MTREKPKLVNLSKSQLLLLLMVWLELIALLFLSICREQISQNLFVLICATLFLTTCFIATLISQDFYLSYAEPALIAKSKMLSAISESDLENDSSVEFFTQPLAVTAEVLVKELVAARQRERLIADFSPEILCCLSPERKFLEINLQAELVIGHPLISLLGNILDGIVLDEDLAGLITYLDDCKQTTNEKTQVAECRIRKGSGELIDLEWQAEWSNSAQCFYCIAKEITQRKENERLKREIAAMVTHDLRAPITGINFLLQNLKRGVLGEISERAKEEISFAQEGVDGVLALINKLLDVDKLEGGRMECDLRPFRLADLYKHVKPLLVKFAERKNIEVLFPVSDMVAYADLAKSGQILSNLLANAIKWSPVNSVVTVSEENKGPSIVILVSDKGPGIPESRQQVIFDRFKSITTGPDQEIASSGLGLYIAKKLAELQLGSIGVNSKPGEGSTFWFSMRQQET